MRSTDKFIAKLLYLILWQFTLLINICLFIIASNGVDFYSVLLITSPLWIGSWIVLVAGHRAYAKVRDSNAEVPN